VTAVEPSGRPREGSLLASFGAQSTACLVVPQMQALGRRFGFAIEVSVSESLAGPAGESGERALGLAPSAGIEPATLGLGNRLLRASERKTGATRLRDLPSHLCLNA
jgi:hypothetical protein